MPLEHNLPSLPRIHHQIDPLSAPSGFRMSTQVPNVPEHRPSVISTLGKHLDDDEDDLGPPRKRINWGSSSLDPIAIESSPEIRRPFTSAANARPPPREDTSDSDSLPNPADLLGHTKSRLVRGRRPDVEQTETLDSVELNTLVFTHPSHPRIRVIRAFKLCDGDSKAAGALIQDPTWNHESSSDFAGSPPPSTSATPSGSGSGSNKRAAEREKGKKSMIYAKRQGLSAPQAIVPAKVIVTPVQPPPDIMMSPVDSKPSRRKTAKRRVDSSGSEAEYSDEPDSDSDDGVFSQSREERYYQAEALKWLNECEPPALVELTGECSQVSRANLY
jgi:SWI/SNF-related matrix-associated actin-dependent regulator of chromatin subfamily A containing DEAD/H box 1